jgi:hypothetical protein
MTEFERGWAAAIEAAKHACDRERLGEERDPTDTAYDLAIDHCIGAISALQCPEQPAEVMKHGAWDGYTWNPYVAEQPAEAKGGGND